MFLNYSACLMITLFKFVYCQKLRMQASNIGSVAHMLSSGTCMWRGDVWDWLGWGWMRTYALLWYMYVTWGYVGLVGVGVNEELELSPVSFQLVKMSHRHYAVWYSVNVKKYRYLMYMNCVFILKIFVIIMLLTLCRISVNFLLKCLACYHKENSFKICNFLNYYQRENLYFWVVLHVEILSLPFDTDETWYKDLTIFILLLRDNFISCSFKFSI